MSMIRLNQRYRLETRRVFGDLRKLYNICINNKEISQYEGNVDTYYHYLNARNANNFGRITYPSSRSARYHSDCATTSVVDTPPDHVKKFDHVPHDNLQSEKFDAEGQNHILDIPSDHEKKQHYVTEPINYEDYLLELPSNDDPTHPSHSFGVFRENEAEDIKILVNNFTAPALASALRERESLLQIAATLAIEGNVERLRTILRPFQRSSLERRRRKRHRFDVSSGFTRTELVILQRYIHRMPRQVSPAAEKRASIVIPLCNNLGVASILFERRSASVRSYKHQVCFPGGMLDEGVDRTIIQTSLRELEEEIGITKEKTEVLGILRCNWQEVASMTGISVTPVVGFIGEVSQLTFKTNRDEVEDLFSISLSDLLDDKKWILKDRSAPIYIGGPYVIFGLTAYLLRKFLEEVVMKCKSYNLHGEE